MNNALLPDEHFTQIPNNLLDALAKAQMQGLITGRERAVIDFIIRNTYGYHKESNILKTSFIAKELGTTLSNISKILKRLENKNIIVRDSDEILFNKHYKEWKTVKLSRHFRNIATNGNKMLQPMETNIATNGNIEPEQKQLKTESVDPLNITNKYNINKTSFTNSEVFTPKRKVFKNNLLKRSTDYKEVNNTNEELQQEHEISQEKKQESDIASFFDKFGELMDFNPSIGYRVNNREFVLLLLKDHSVEDIIKAVRIGKKKYKHEGKDPKQFITLRSLINFVDIWLSEEEKLTIGGWR